MAYSLKKMWTAMAASLLGAAGLVSAAPPFVAAGPDGDCCPVNNCDFGACGGPALDGCGTWFLSAEGLYWKAAEDGLAYATHENGATPTSTDSTALDVDVLNPRQRWEWGVRVGLGYEFSCGWDFRAYYTHFHTKARGLATVRNPEAETDTLNLTYGTNFILSDESEVFPNPTDIFAHWKLRLDLADFELGYDFRCGSCISFRPHVGLRAVWLDQKYDIFATAPATFFESEVIVVDAQNVFLKSEFEGIGLRTGFDTSWCIGCGFSIYGNAAASLVYGKFHNHTHEEDLYFTQDGDSLEHIEDHYRLRDNYHATRLITDAALGLRWSQAYCCDTVIVTLNIGWEHHLFIDQNRFENFVSNSDFFGSTTGGRNPQISRGDLCIHGWTFGAKVDF